MARQKGIIKLKGGIGDYSFYKTRDGYMAREKGGVDGQRIANDPAFQRTRENGVEFGNGGRAGKILRTALRSRIQKVKDGRMSSRLTKAMIAVVKSDTVNVRGKRNVIEGDLNLLQGFDFNNDGQLGTSFLVPYTSVIDRVAGTLEVAIPEMMPSDDIVAPQGATHCRIVSAGAEIDFVNGTFTVDENNSADIIIGPQTEAPLTLTSTVTAGSTLPLFLAFGLEFYQEVNGAMYPLKNGTFNSLQLIEIDA